MPKTTWNTSASETHYNYLKAKYKWLRVLECYIEEAGLSTDEIDKKIEEINWQIHELMKGAVLLKHSPLPIPTLHPFTNAHD